MKKPELAQLRGDFCLAAGQGDVEAMQPYFKAAANDPFYTGMLTMAFAYALAEQREQTVAPLVTAMSGAGISGDEQKTMATAQGRGKFFSGVLQKMEKDQAA